MSTARIFRLWLALAAACLATLATAQTSLRVEIAGSRSRDEALARADQAVRVLNWNFAQLSKRAARPRGVPLTLPARVELTLNGRPLDFPAPRGRGRDPIQLEFDTTGERAFPPEYRALLQAVFNQARPVIDAVFGAPLVGGPVRVANFDADIGDRDAVAGGYYVPNNGQGVQEIRFPIYLQNETAAVNFLHTILLAYLGPRSYPTDGWQEGIVRAATMRIARTPGGLPGGLDPQLIENVLESTYDVGPYYDWSNGRALASPLFIAPNLRATPLPPGGSTGGLYLLRYQMAGSAMAKVIVQYPGFLSAFNAAYGANPNAYRDREALAGLGQQVLDALTGQADSRIEGLTFRDWARRQYVLETANVPGFKLLVQPFAVTSNLGNNDFGVFALQTHYFETLANGDERLLSGQSFPAYWSPTFTRFFTTAQDDRIDIAAGYGSVSPNFPAAFGNDPYRVAVDVPVGDLNERRYFPAGAVATAGNPQVSTLFGSVIGIDNNPGNTLRLRVTWPGGQIPSIPVVNFAFGARITTGDFLQPQPVTIELIRTPGDEVLAVRRVNKSLGALALDLRVNGDVTAEFPAGLPRGLSALGIPVEPYLSSPGQIAGLSENQLLVARWNPIQGRYDLGASAGPFRKGLGFFLRADLARPLRIEGQTDGETPEAIALRPGWNLISVPKPFTVNFTDVQVVSATGFPTPFNDPISRQIIAADLFTLVPGPNDPASGAPENGSYAAVTRFDPGRALFVRVFAPEGALLLFRAPRGNGFPDPPRGPRDGWSIRATVLGPSEETTAIFGQNPNAGSGFDRAHDSELPPAMGGLQAAFGTESRLYRDTRRTGRAEAFRLTVEGLRPGVRYLLRFENGHGPAPRFLLVDGRTRTSRQMRAGGVYRFTARGRTHTFELRTYGGGQ